VIWPPIPYGFAEEIFELKHVRPPWWWQESSVAAASAPTQKKKKAYVPTPWDRPHWLGTDQNGRDVLSRLIWGSRVSLSVGIVSVSIYVTLGIVIGALAGYFRGYVDLIISRFIEIVICFPTFFLILTIVALRGPSIWNIMIVIGLTSWTGIARLIRAEFLRLVDQEFVLAGRALGYSSGRLIFRHILPNALAPVLVSASFGIAGAILTESALSYLGLGITIPIPSWGSLLLDGRNSEGVAPWLIIIPGLAIFLTITCYNLIGEALRDASDPRLRGSR
jgi:peptide/nickel transport system permease protein